ncbi:MAG: type II secretion system F family protein [Actinomycetales bacterium]|nr:type II secretion system F family protein [Actinomycetales bacterium]
MSLKSSLSSAGFGHLPSWQVLGGGAVVVVAVSLSLIRFTGVAAFGLAGAVLSMAAIVEALLALTAARTQALISALPEVAESLASGVSSGQELGQSLGLLAKHGPKALSKSFIEFNGLVARGFSLEDALGWLQRELGNVYGDQLVQLLLVSLRIGGSGLVANLNRLASDIRSEAALDGELRAKQGWVAGTAKLGVLAPWLIVLFLNQRPEAHAFYSSSGGFSLMLAGLFICLVAYFFIQLMARLPKPKRVFVDVH